jgi:hypothetical protein
MMNGKTMLLIFVLALVSGLLLGYRTGIPSGWQRALVAAVAFALLGWLMSTLSARRR